MNGRLAALERDRGDTRKILASGSDGHRVFTDTNIEDVIAEQQSRAGPGHWASVRYLGSNAPAIATIGRMTTTEAVSNSLASMVDGIARQPQRFVLTSIDKVAQSPPFGPIDGRR